eukprot:scaffold3418_cov124-Isochrysis_galbana.AAC.3
MSVGERVRKVMSEASPSPRHLPERVGRERGLGKVRVEEAGQPPGSPPPPPASPNPNLGNTHHPTSHLGPLPSPTALLSPKA